jgi:hypothetical protein
MTLDEALEKAVLGFKVRHEGLQAGAYIYYEFEGWRIQFTHNGRKGSSSGWHWDDYGDQDKVDTWYCLDADPNNPGWPDFVQTNWDIEAAADRIDPEEPTYDQLPEEAASWGEPIVCPSAWETEDGHETEQEKQKREAATIKQGWASFNANK